MSSTDLVLTRPDATLTMDTLRAQMEAAKRFVDSGLLPAAIKTPQQALLIMQAGREMGVPPTYALRNINVIKGKPGASAELLMALVRRTYGQAAIRVKTATNEACTVEYREQGWDGVSSLTFTLEDAKRAGLLGNDMYGKYPRAMLRSRAVSEVVRMSFPECIAGLHTPEELGADVVVNPDGGLEVREIPVIDGRAVPGPAPQVIEGQVVDSVDTLIDPPETYAYRDDLRRYATVRYKQLRDFAEHLEVADLDKIKAFDPEKANNATLRAAVERLELRFKDCVDDLTDADVAALGY